MRRLLLSGLFALLSAAPLAANTDERRWMLATGEMFRAELVSCDEAAGTVRLKFNNAEERIYPIDDFASLDRAWLAEWLEMSDDLDALLQQLGGKLEHITTTGEQPTDLFVYYPSSALATDAPVHPALILFSPGGKAALFVKRHMEAAEAAGLIVIACGQFRNTTDQAEGEAFGRRFEEMFPQLLRRVRLDPARLHLGGTSGGALRAFLYSSKYHHPWAGIYSNGGWLGGRKNYDLPFPGGMRIAIVNGSLDDAANRSFLADGEVLRRAGNTLGVFAFEGGHQIPPVHSQLQSFRWLLEGLEVEAE